MRGLWNDGYYQVAHWYRLPIWFGRQYSFCKRDSTNAEFPTDITKPKCKICARYLAELNQTHEPITQRP